MYLFVYGTLKSVFDNEHALNLRENAKLIGEGSVFGRLYMLGWYPGLVLDDMGYEVRGEVYEIGEGSESFISTLDKYEGVEDGDYRRVLRNVWLGNKQIKCWVYETLISSEIELTTGEFIGLSNEG